MEADKCIKIKTSDLLRTLERKYYTLRDYIKNLPDSVFYSVHQQDIVSDSSNNIAHNSYFRQPTFSEIDDITEYKIGIGLTYDSEKNCLIRRVEDNYV